MPVNEQAIHAERLRQKIVTGAAVDYKAGTRAGPRRFGLCLRLGLRRALSGRELENLTLVYRRPAGQQLAAHALNRLAVPVGERCGGRQYVPELIEASKALGTSRLKPGPIRGLGLAYGPYIGVACRLANSTRCEKIGFDLVLTRPAAAVSVSIAGRSLRLQTPGPFPHNAGARGRDWGGYLQGAGLEREGSPFHIPPNGRKAHLWAGEPPVYLPVRIVVTRPNGRAVVARLPRVFLSPGFG